MGIITITTTHEDDCVCARKIHLKPEELSTLKMIYKNVMLKKCSDILIESSSYKYLMDRGLLEFSVKYRNVVLTDVSRIVIESKKESGKVELEGGDGESVVVEWCEFV